MTHSGDTKSAETIVGGCVEGYQKSKRRQGQASQPLAQETQVQNPSPYGKFFKWTLLGKLRSERGNVIVLARYGVL
jgi:hypothetical protein